MKMRTLTLTTIGLPIRTELRIKSLLAVVNAKTTDDWSFSEGSADVVICDPSSALSIVALKRCRANATRCVSLIKDDETVPLPSTQSLRDPVRAGDFLDLLNAVSATLNHHEPAHAIEPTIDATDPFRFGTTLRDLLKSSSSDVFMLETGRFATHVVPASRSVYLRQPIDARAMRELTQPNVAVGVMQYPSSYAEQLLNEGAHKSSADSLLWRLGIHGPNDQMLTELPRGAAFKLRRWPDFGRLEHSADHLRIAARLSRKESGITELASSLGQTACNITPFINACALCELLKVVVPTMPDSPGPVPRTAARTTRYTGIFQSIRSVLGFGVSSS